MMKKTLTNSLRLDVRLARAAALCLLALAGVLLQAGEARAQWTTSGTTTSTTNNVGVGTSAPSSALEVQGPHATLTLSQAGVPNKVTMQATDGADLHLSSNARWNGDFVGWGRYDTSRASWNFFLATSPGAGADYAGLRRAAPSSTGLVWTDIMRFTNEGHVGIGTTAVRYPLTVKANTNLAPLNLIGGTGNVEIWKDANPWPSKAVAFGSAVPGNPAGDDLHLSTYNGSAWASRLTISNATGNVGIGTASPDKLLTVQGQIPSWGASMAVFRSTSSFNGNGLALDAAGTGNNNIGFLVNGANKAGLGWDISRQFLGFVNHQYSSAEFALRLNGDGNLTYHDGRVVGSAPVLTVTPTGDVTAAGTIMAGNIVAKYQDLAEWVPSKQKLSAGTVVVVDPAGVNGVLASATSYDTSVAGVISAQPGIALGERGEGKVLVATTGRVKVKVDATRAPIRAGDLLVTSDVAGVAMKSEPMTMNGRKFHSPGTIIGKALEPLEKGTGEILVLLSLQ